MLALLFIFVPAVEIYVLISVGGILGALPTFLIIVVTGTVGAALARSQGTAAIRQVQAALANGQRVGQSLVEAALVLVSAVLMLTPGFITDAVGLLLLLPLIRSLVAGWVVAWGAKHVVERTVRYAATTSPFDSSQQRSQASEGTSSGSANEQDPPPPGVIDV